MDTILWYRLCSLLSDSTVASIGTKRIWYRPISDHYFKSLLRLTFHTARLFCDLIDLYYFSIAFVILTSSEAKIVVFRPYLHTNYINDTNSYLTITSSNSIATPSHWVSVNGTKLKEVHMWSILPKGSFKVDLTNLKL